MKYLALITILLLSFNSYAAVYEQNSGSGIIFSDTPASNAQPVTLPHNTNSISFPQTTTQPSDNHAAASLPTLPTLPSQSQATPTKKTERVPYTSFAMTDPTDQETFQNQPDISVTLKIEPSLQAGDTVQLFVDGKAVGGPTSDLSSLAIHQVDRGEHQLSATLNDSSGHMLSKIDPITLYIHYSAIPTGSGAVPAGSVDRSVPGMPGAAPAANAPTNTYAPTNANAPTAPAAPNLPAAPALPAAP